MPEHNMGITAERKHLGISQLMPDACDAHV